MWFQPGMPGRQFGILPSHPPHCTVTESSAWTVNRHRACVTSKIAAEESVSRLARISACSAIGMASR